MGHIKELPDDTMDWKTYYSHGLPPNATDAQWRKFIGNRGWEIVHGAVENYPCPPCRYSGTRLFRGVHDIVNVLTGKPAMYPQDLIMLRDEATRAIEKIDGFKVRHAVPMPLRVRMVGH